MQVLGLLVFGWRLRLFKRHRKTHASPDEVRIGAFARAYAHSHVCLHGFPCDEVVLWLRDAEDLIPQITYLIWYALSC